MNTDIGTKEINQSISGCLYKNLMRFHISIAKSNVVEISIAKSYAFVISIAKINAP